MVAIYPKLIRQDRVISLEAQRRVQKAVGIDQAVSLETGHVPLLTAPNELATAILELIDAKVVAAG